METIAYTRTGRDTIIGVGAKGGNVVLRETLRVSTDGTFLTLTYLIYAGIREIAHGTAIFEARGNE